MTNEPRQDLPILFFNAGGEDRQAYREMFQSGIPCEFRPAAEEPTPLLLVGYQTFAGLAEIREFISSHNQQRDL